MDAALLQCFIDAALTHAAPLVTTRATMLRAPTRHAVECECTLSLSPRPRPCSMFVLVKLVVINHCLTALRITLDSFFPPCLAGCSLLPPVAMGAASLSPFCESLALCAEPCVRPMRPCLRALASLSWCPEPACHPRCEHLRLSALQHASFIHPSHTCTAGCQRPPQEERKLLGVNRLGYA